MRTEPNSRPGGQQLAREGERVLLAQHDVGVVEVEGELDGEDWKR